MSFRTVVITQRCKLDLRMGYMEVRQIDGKKRIFIDEIGTLILENPSVSMTGCLISELMKKKVKVIFCDAKHNPQGEIIPYYGSYDSPRKLRQQLAWTREIKDAVWLAILTSKIQQQALFLNELGKDRESKLLFKYLEELSGRDEHNREGHAAKVYFNSLFGMGFTRDDGGPVNAALNYGYSILLSLINREVVAAGYSTQIGLFHDNVFNFFNFSCDLMEPYRVLIDRFVYEKRFHEFEVEEKHQMLEILQKKIYIKGTCQLLVNAASIYLQSVFHALDEGDVSLIQEYRNEL